MRHTLTATLSRVTLSPLAPEDIEPLRLLRNSKKEFFLNPAEITAEQQRAWYDKYLDKPGDYMFRIARKENPAVFLGAVALYDVDQAAGTAEFGRIVIDREKAGEGGLGAEATRCVCGIGFRELGLRRITLEVFRDNAAAIRTYEKAGFHPVRQDDTLLYMEITPENLNA